MASKSRIPYVEVPPRSCKSTPSSPTKKRKDRSPSPSESARPIKSPSQKPFVAVPAYPRTPRTSSSRKKRLPPSSKPTSNPSIPPSPRHRRLSSDLAPTEDETVVGDLFELDKHTQYIAEEQVGEALGETIGDGYPIRYLHDFCVFTADGHQLVAATELLDLLQEDGQSTHCEYGASGVVSDSDNEGAVHLGILNITAFDVHDYNGAQFDVHVYIKTALAWYILDSPSEVYQPLWEPFATRHQFGHLVLKTSLEEKKLTYEELVNDLPSYVKRNFGKLPDFGKVCKRLTAEEFRSDEITAYIMQVVDRACAVAPIKHVPLIRAFAAAVAGGNFFTPIVKRVVERYLLSDFSVVGSEQEEEQERVQYKRAKHRKNPENVCWGDKFGLPGAGFYSSVTIDGTIYTIGQVVAVVPGQDLNDSRQQSDLGASKYCINTFANKVWFVQIKYFFENDNEKMFHGQWLQHGSRTWLQEATHSQELFLLKDCDDIDVAAIYQQCDVDFLSPIETAKPDERIAKSKSYFCQLVYDETTFAYTSLPTTENSSRLSKHSAAREPCENCGREARDKLISSVRRVKHGFAQYNHVYHVGDFVYIKPDAGAKENHLLFIARICRINEEREGKHLSVRYYSRYNDDSRRIYRTSNRNDVDIEDLDGPCYVRHLDPRKRRDQEEIQRWVQKHPDHYYTNQAGKPGAWVNVDREDFIICNPCFENHCQELEASELYVLHRGPVQVLELFSGAGGLSQGLGHSPLLSTKWAVELSVPAAETFRLNHPETRVLNVDVNDLLRYCVSSRDGREPLRSSNRTDIPDDQIPRPGDVGLLCGGPPCQSFSGANFHKKKGDPRSGLPFTMLSLAEILQPKFFLMENVTGLLWHSDSGEEKITFKLIIQALIALGYQARFAVLQAGQYGAPQCRQRVFILGARRDLELPEFPIPTHASPEQALSYKLVNGLRTVPVKRGRAAEDNYLSAPHPAVSIEDAIGDLPPFDWINPHRLVPETAADVHERNQRAAQGIRQFDATAGGGIGFLQAVEYATTPSTPYQRAMRVGASRTVDYHYTAPTSLKVAEISASIPLKPSDHRALPKVLRYACNPGNHGITYGRRDKTEHFTTALTSVVPSSRGSQVLHPEQKRAYSVAEAKRAQGFPDNYTLYSNKTSQSGQIKDYYRHIGNAVPVPLAAALGRSLEAVFIRQWMKEPRPSSPEL